MKIIKQFENPALRFCLLDKTENIEKGKSPGIQKGWQEGLTLKQIANAVKENNQASGNRIGVIGGPGNLRIIDVDKKGKWFESILVIIEAEFPKTLTVTTISGGRHYYYYADELPNIDFKDDSGEIRANNRMVVAAQSELCGKKYEVMKDLPIATLNPFLIKKFLSDYLPQKTEQLPQTESVGQDIQKVLDNQKDVKLQTLLKGEYVAWGSRSEAEAALVQKLVFYSLSEKQVNYVMENHSKIGKWKDAPDGYKKMTFNKAMGWQPKPEPLLPVSTRGKLNLKDFKYFLNLKKDKRYLIEDFIYPKTTIMLYSPPGQFKSLLALQAAICIANGKPFLGLKTKKKAVLYCDKENNEQLIKERLMGLHKGMDLKRKTFPLQLLVRNGDLKDLVFVEELKATIKENKIKLVIFDTLHRFADYEENKADDINRLYTTVFQPIMDDCDCSVMFLHHTNKNGGYRGSGDFLGMVDTSYSVVRRKGSNRFDLINEKSRSGEIETICGEIDFEENQIRINKKDTPISAEDKAEQDQKFKEAIPIIKEMFSINQQQHKRKTIIDEFKANHTGEFSESTIKRVLNWFVDKSELGRTKGGVYTRMW